MGSRRGGGGDDDDDGEHKGARAKERNPKDARAQVSLLFFERGGESEKGDDASERRVVDQPSVI